MNTNTDAYYLFQFLQQITGLEQHCNAAGGATCRNVYQEDCH